MARKRQKRMRNDRARRGATALEFAIVLPIFLLVIVGIIEFGRAVMVQQVITNCAREGARKAVVPGATNAQVEAVIDNYMTNAGLSGHSRSIVNVTRDPETLSTALSGDEISITVSIDYADVSWGLTTWLADKTLSSSVVMRKE